MTGNALNPSLFPATAQMMIVNPLSRGGIVRLFPSRPSTATRVR